MGFPGTCFHLSTSVRQHDAIRRSSVIEVGTTAKRTSNPTKTLRNRHTRLFRDREAEAAAPREHRVGRGRGRSRGTRPAQRLRLARQRSALGVSLPWLPILPSPPQSHRGNLSTYLCTSTLKGTNHSALVQRMHCTRHDDSRRRVIIFVRMYAPSRVPPGSLAPLIDLKTRRHIPNHSPPAHTRSSLRNSSYRRHPRRRGFAFPVSAAPFPSAMITRAFR